MGQAIFVRQKTIHCGKEYREVDIIPYTAEQARKDRAGRKRAKKEKISAPKQQSLNDRNAQRYLTWLTNGNFDENDLHVTVTYQDGNLPKSIEEAERLCNNYLRRIQHARKKRGLPPLKYIKVTSHTDSKDGTPARIHHHIIMNGGLDRDAIEKIWGLGYANADRLQMQDGTLAGLTRYIAMQTGGKKRWSSSRNLIRPYATNNDSSWSNRAVDKLGREKPGREYWERKFPGWTLINDDYGKEYIYNEVTATWSIYIKLRRIM